MGKVGTSMRQEDASYAQSCTGLALIHGSGALRRAEQNLLEGTDGG